MNRRLLWSLLLAFLLPLAQLGAAAHEVSHVKQAPVAVHCDQCTLGAAVTGGGAPSMDATPAVLHVAHAAPVAPVAPVAGPEPFRAFASRAPPLSH